MRAETVAMKPRGNGLRSHGIEKKHIERRTLALQQIVVPTDFTHVSGTALAYALALSKTYGSKVIALHAVDPFEYQFGPKESSDLKREQVWMAAREDMASWLKPASSSVETVLTEGDPAVALAKLAAERTVDLVVLGTAGRQHAARALFGSVSEEVFRSTPRPVLVLGPNIASLPNQIALRKLVFATDLEPHSLTTLPALAILAADLNAEVSVIRAVHPDIRSAAERYRIRRETEQKVEAAAGPELCKYIKEIHVVFDDIVNAICERAVEAKADAIVLGVRGNVEWDRAATHIPWALAHQVIAQATCPVLTLRG